MSSATPADPPTMPSSADPSVRVEERGPGRWAIVFVRHLAHPPPVVWAALTEPDQLSAWAPYLPDRDLGTTGAATVRMLDQDEPGAAPAPSGEDMAGEVLVADPPTRLEHRWGEDVLAWELTPVPTGTRLTLHHVTGEDRGQAGSFAAGWHICADSIELLLTGDPRPNAVGSAAHDHGWSELAADYTRMLVPGP